jgi:hypothetical protein
MHIEPIAVALLSVLLLAGYLARSTVTVALFASLPFGATAIATLSAMGGSTLVLFTPLAALLVATTLLRRSALNNLRTILADQWVATLVAFLVVYVVAGALMLPRLFEGQTTVFVPGDNRIIEVPLAPVSGNINQSCYFIVSGLCFFAFSVLLLKPGYFRVLKIAMFGFAGLHAALCIVDLCGKLAGDGDVLGFLRTAGYSMLSDVQAEGFWRIVGAYPEASTCAAATATAFAFTFSYWRVAGSRPAFVLTLILLALLLLSTSSTGYIVFAALAAVFLGTLLFDATRGRLRSRDIWILACATIAVIAALVAAIVTDHALEPIVQLFQGTIVNKASSASAAERFYWNYKSYMAFLDTGGLGVGLGSSRASSWAIAVLSQLGILGALVFGVLTWQILKPPYTRPPAPELLEIAATCRGLRAAAFATMVALVTSAGNADPGIMFFTALAALIAGRKLLAREPATSPRRVPQPWYDRPITAPVH